MALGIGGFKPTIGDLVKVLNEAYEPIAKGTIGRIVAMSETGDICFIEDNEDVPVSTRDLELIAYRIGRYNITAKAPVAKDRSHCCWRDNE